MRRKAARNVGLSPLQAAVRWKATTCRSSDLSRDATRAAEANAARAMAFLAPGATLSVAQEDCRELSLKESSVDAVVADVPFGNRNRLVWAARTKAVLAYLVILYIYIYIRYI